MTETESTHTIRATASCSNTPAGHLLLLGCSHRKRAVKGRLPALELYDGVNFRVVRAFLNQRGWPPGLCIKILSAKYGLIDATAMIEHYDQRLDGATARKINYKVLRCLTHFGKPSSVFVNMGKDYLPAINGIDRMFQKERIVQAKGGIGLKMAQMKRWLNDLPSQTATLPGVEAARPYLYFFPDWDDYVTEPFIHETVSDPILETTKQYAHELFGAKATPYDGMLVSLAQIYTGKGTLSRLDINNVKRTDLRKAMKIPDELLLFGDCGAFSYAFEDEPPFTPEYAAHLYHCFGFDAGASVDHIPLSEIVVKNNKGKLVKKALTKAKRRRRMQITTQNAEAFLSTCKKNQYQFVPIGVIHGLDTKSYAVSVHQYLDMGYQHIALGGLVPKSDSEILEICCAVRDAIQTRTRTEKENIWLHLFGILRPKIQSIFRLLGISSFDSASYLRKAWLRSDQNYLAADGQRWYSTIRVPLSSSKKLLKAAIEKNISEEELRRREMRCLVSLNNFDGTERAHQNIVDAINEYGPLLERRGEDNHFYEKHDELLSDRPWEKCRCPVCRQLGIDIVVFRGNGRNKRRGFHNTWVFYHKLLHEAGKRRTINDPSK